MLRRSPAPAAPLIGGGRQSPDRPFRARPEDDEILVETVGETLGHFQWCVPDSSRELLEPEGFVRDDKAVVRAELGSQGADVEGQARRAIPFFFPTK